ncbi:MAG TPA: hypothetical protein VK928_13415, partial [Longimicrobiales bacterium]|nr:hypothetical protein [Longimicrobiales bacterium]
SRRRRRRVTARKAGAKPHAKRAEATAAVVVELQTLRQQVDTMTERYRMRVSGQLADLLRALHGDPALGQSPLLVTVKAAEEIHALVGSADIRPKKGRAKDFARMEELVAALTELVPPER